MSFLLDALKHGGGAMTHYCRICTEPVTFFALPSQAKHGMRCPTCNWTHYFTDQVLESVNDLHDMVDRVIHEKEHEHKAKIRDDDAAAREWNEKWEPVDGSYPPDIDDEELQQHANHIVNRRANEIVTRAVEKMPATAKTFDVKVTREEFDILQKAGYIQ